jgi:hypothetical protein
MTLGRQGKAEQMRRGRELESHRGLRNGDRRETHSTGRWKQNGGLCVESTRHPPHDTVPGATLSSPKVTKTEVILASFVPWLTKPQFSVLI